MTSPTEPLTAEERAIIQLQVNNTYSTFLKRVADGRHVAVAHVDSVGQGRVWTGSQALELGLVDKIGNTKSAIQAAASKAGLKSYKVAEYPTKDESFLSILSGSKDQIRAWLFAEEFGDFKQYILDVKKTLQQSGVQARMPYSIEIY